MAGRISHARVVSGLAGWVFAVGLSSAAFGQEPAAEPDVPIALDAPAGWSCDANSMVAVGDEMLPVMMCLPHEGGSPISFRRMARSETPASLEAFLSSETAQAAARDKEDVLVAPRRVSLGEREAVESAFQNPGVVHDTDGTPSDIEMIVHTLTFQLDGAFFQCQLDASPGLYNEDLRKRLLQFCSSARTTPAPASPGRS